MRVRMNGMGSPTMRSWLRSAQRIWKNYSRTMSSSLGTVTQNSDLFASARYWRSESWIFIKRNILIHFSHFDTFCIKFAPTFFFKKHPSKSGPNRWGVFEIDGERSSVGAKLQRPLMFHHDDTSGVASDETSIQVIDSSFVFFTSIWGIALPGLRVGSTPTPNPEAAKCASDNPSLTKIHFSSCNPAGQWGNNASEK